MEHGKPKSQERLESERFWADVERTAQEVAAWPEWKRGITERFKRQQEEERRFEEQARAEASKER